MSKKRIDTTLREAALNSGKSQRSIAIASGLERTSVARFLRGDTSIRLDRAAALAEYFGLELRPIEGKKKRD